MEEGQSELPPLTERSVDQGPPWSERLVTAFCGGLAFWTLSSQVAVALGANLLQLLTWFALLSAGFGAALLGARRQGLVDLAWPASPAGSPTSKGPAFDDIRASHRLLGLVAIALAVFGTASYPLIQWWTITACLLVGWLVAWKRPGVTPEPDPGRWQEPMVWILSLGCAVYSLLVHRPDADDSFYINLAAAAIDRPDMPLLAHDTLHGIAFLGPHNPVYKLHSWELANAAVGFLAGISALATFHVLAAAFVALLVPMAWGVLLRQLAPRTWMPTLVSLLALLIVVAETHRWYSNFAFVRVWQGKAVFLSVLLPLLWAWGIRLGAKPCWRQGACLFAGLVASVGATSSALWAGPIAVGAALVVAPRRSSFRWAAVCLLAVSSYSVALGLSLKTDLARISQRAVDAAEQPGFLLPDALSIVLGDGQIRSICLVALAGAWTVAPPGIGRRFAALGALVPWATILNPLFESLVAGHVTGPSYWRALWVLPVPLLLALLLAAPWTLAPSRRLLATMGWLASTLLLLTLSETQTWSGNNSGASLRCCEAYKIPDETRPAVGLLTHNVPYGATVVAPRYLSTWLPVLQDGVHPVAVRDYLKLKGKPRRDRLRMVLIAEGRMRTKESLSSFRAALWRYRVEAVFFAVEPRGDMIRATLRSAAFEPALQSEEWEIWVRRGLDPSGDPRPDRPIQWR